MSAVKPEGYAETWVTSPEGDHSMACPFHPNDWHNQRFGHRLLFARHLMERGVLSEYPQPRAEPAFARTREEAADCLCGIDPCECMDLTVIPY